uniref:Bloodthirsty-related gene family, member 2 n=1 Tax=Sparus aurata TaxID=8175 RepID=A0A671VDQ0_SPAAU
MSAASCLLTEDQFLCSICLDVFTDPVSTPCGHNFCKICITKHWNVDVLYKCPNCKEVFNTRPKLQVNTFISEMAAQFRQSVQQEASSSSSEHHVSKPGDAVPLKDAQIQQMIQKRRLKIQEMKRSVKLSKKDAAREIAAGVQVFSALKESVERSQAELIDTIKEKQRETEKQAEGFIKELEQEISELEKRSSEETLSKQMKKLLLAELKRVQQYAVDVTLDPDTAQPNLILSGDGKKVNCGYVKKNLPDNPERFDTCANVLAKQHFSSGRFYYEVQVKEKTEWDLGVARETISRKGNIKLSPQNGYWTICLRNNNKYKACAGPSVRLSLKCRPEKVGVFVDYEEGLVSFYDVDAAALIYSFTGCCFTQKLYPYFCPSLNDGGKNSAPLIISPVNQTE